MPETFRVGDRTYTIDSDDPETIARVKQKLAQREARMGPIRSGITYGAQGFNVGLANVLGLPVDVATGGLNIGARAMGLPEIEDPVGGAASLRSGLESVGAGYEGIQDIPEQYRPLARGGEVLGESLPMAAFHFDRW